MIEFVATADDISKVRFALSPIGEAVYSFRMLAAADRRTQHQLWLEDIRARLRSVDFTYLRAVIPPSGYVPDFLTPSPGLHPLSIEDELEIVRATPPEQLVDEVSWTMTDRRIPARWRAANKQAHRVLVDEPEHAVRMIVELLAGYWRLAIQPYWRRLHGALRSDIHARTRTIEESGVAAVFSSLHERVGWQDDRLTVQTAYDYQEKLDGQGLVLVPSMYCGPEVLTTIPPMQSMLVYPQPGAAEFWSPAPSRHAHPLGSLLGNVRAAVLEALTAPMSTSELAAAIGVTPGAVSQHLGVLNDCGLVQRKRLGKRVVYSHTAVGEALVTSAGPKAHIL